MCKSDRRDIYFKNMPRLNYVCHRNLVTRIIIMMPIFSLGTSTLISPLPSSSPLKAWHDLYGGQIYPSLACLFPFSELAPFQWPDSPGVWTTAAVNLCSSLKSLPRLCGNSIDWGQAKDSKWSCALKSGGQQWRRSSSLAGVHKTVLFLAFSEKARSWNQWAREYNQLRIKAVLVCSWALWLSTERWQKK